MLAVDVNLLLFVIYQFLQIA